MPEGFNFLVWHEFATPGLFKSLSNCGARILIEIEDRCLFGHREHHERDRVLVFGGKLADFCDSLLKQLCHFTNIQEQTGAVKRSLPFLKHLARIQNPLRIERPFESPHNLQGNRIFHTRQKRAFQPAYSMFGGN